MSREEIQKLLGGYATDTLSEAERSALFAAALEDQELFDALAKEQALRDVLQDPSARQQLIEALGTAREPFAVRAWRWLGWLRRPAALAMAGGVAVLLIVGGLVLRQTRHAARREVVVADALVPPSASALKAIEPPVVARKPTRPARVPAGPALPEAQPVAKAAPSAPPAPPVATGALADTSETRRQELQAAPAEPQSLVARSGAPMAAMGRFKAVHAAAAKPAVAYTLLLKDADGAYSPAPSGAVFHAGDSVRLQVAPSESGYIYLLQREASVQAGAGWRLVERQSVEKGQRYMLPSTGGLQSDEPARLELWLVFSRVKQTAFANSETAGVGALASKAQAASTITIEYR